MNIVTAVQARMTSTRLPNKVLLPVCGEPVLIRMIERVNRAVHRGTVIVATSVLPEDDIIEHLCDDRGILCFRGSLDDLLDRHYWCAVVHQADVLVKIPSDCPLIDPGVIDDVIGYYLAAPDAYDYVSNLHTASYPDGNDVEVIPFRTLEIAWEESVKNFEREHTTPFIWEKPGRFRIGNLRMPGGADYSTTHRWTLDFEQDYLFIRAVYERLLPSNPEFIMEDILALVGKHPEIAALNSMYAGRYWYDNHLDELLTIDEYKRKKNRS